MKFYNRYSGRLLEKFFKELLSVQGKYNLIGSYWNKDHTDEIDIVAIDDINKNILFVEVKSNPKKINISNLKEKSLKLLKDYHQYEPKWIGLSFNNIKDYLS